MSTATTAEMRLLFPQFADAAQYPDASIELWFTQFPLRFKPASFRLQACMATYLYSAHKLVKFPPLTAPGSNAGNATVRGPVSSESVIDSSRSYGGARADAASGGGSALHMEFGDTEYGIALIAIIITRAKARARIARGGVP